MDSFKDSSLFVRRKRAGKSLNSSPDSLGLDQKAVLFDRPQAGESPDESPLTLSSRRPWFKLTSVVALVGYIGQLACQLVAPIVWASSLWIAQANVARAMEDSKWRSSHEVSSISRSSLQSSGVDGSTPQRPVKPAASLPKHCYFLENAGEPTKSALMEKIFDYLSLSSLKVVTQVSHAWHRIEQTLQDQRLRLSKEGYFPLIVEVTDVEANEVDRTKRRLAVYKRSILQNPQDQELEVIASFEKRLRQPEVLIEEEIRKNGTLREDLLNVPSLNEDHPALTTLRQLIADLKEAGGAQPGRKANGKPLWSILTPLVAHYEHYLATLLTLPVARRSAYLEPKAILSGEGLLSSVSNPGWNNLQSFDLPVCSYRMTQEMALEFLSKDRYNRFIKTNEQGSHAVTFRKGPNGGVHFKANTTSVGLDPGMEAAMYWLSRVLWRDGMAITSLLTLNEVDIKSLPDDSPARGPYGVACATGQEWDVFFTEYPEFKAEFTIPVSSHLLQTAHHVQGIPLDKFINKVYANEFSYDDLDKNAFSQQVIIGLLTNPSDGTPGNFMVRTDQGKPYPIVGIDNDMAMGPDVVQVPAWDPTTKKKSMKHAAEVRNILYCLPLMQTPIAESVRKRLLTLNGEALLFKWLGMVRRQEQDYQRLCHNHYEDDKGNDHPYLSESQYKDELHLPVRFMPGIFTEIAKTWCKMQDILRVSPTLTHMELMKHVQPLAGRYYEAMLKRYSQEEMPPLATFQHICHSTYENLYLEDVLADQLIGESSSSPNLMAGEATGNASGGRGRNRQFLKNQQQSLSAANLSDAIMLTRMLVEATASTDIIKDRTQRVEEAVYEFLGRIDLETHPDKVNLFQVVSQSFGDLLKTIQQTWRQVEKKNIAADQAAMAAAQSIHPSWYQDRLLLTMLQGKADLSVIRFLLDEMNLDIGVTDHEGQGALHISAAVNAPYSVLETLVKGGAPLGLLDDRRLAPLDIAMEKGNREAFQHLVQLGAYQGHTTTACKFYNRHVQANDATQELRQSFLAFMGRRPEIDWHVSLSHFLPTPGTQALPPQAASQAMGRKASTSVPVPQTTRKPKTLGIKGKALPKMDLQGKNRSTGSTGSQITAQKNARKVALAETITLSGPSTKSARVMTSTLGTRELPVEVRKQIFDGAGNFKVKSQTGTHLVSYAEVSGGVQQVYRSNQDTGCSVPLKAHGLYFKVYPELPGIEEAVGWLTREILGYGAPYTEVVKLGGHPVLLSQGIEGKTLLEALKADPLVNPAELNQLDPESVSGMILLAMLTNPEDGKPDNYVLEPINVQSNAPQQPGYRLVGVDNDHAFVPAVVRNQADRRNIVVQVKTILYCLDQMTGPIHPAIREKILSLSPRNLIRQWLRDLKRLNNSYSALFTPEEQERFLREQESFMGVPFQPGAVAHLYEKLTHMRDILAGEGNANISHMELLSKLEPRLAKRYKPAFEKPQSVLMRFREVDVPFYQAGKDGGYTTITSSAHVLQSMNIPLEENIFELIREGKGYGPVQALEELDKIEKEIDVKNLQHLALRTGTWDILNTLTLESSRAAFLEQLDFANLQPSQQDAILQILEGKRLQALTLKNCSRLKDYHLLKGLTVEHLVKADLRGCQGITSKGIAQLAIAASNLEELNLAGITTLKKLVPEKKGVFLEFPSLTTLTLQGCVELASLAVSAIRLKYLNTDGCPKITPEIRDKVLSTRLVYERFLNGRLIYKPNTDNDIGKVELRIADLANPLEGTFDLSQCGDTGNQLSISTGYKKGTKSENKGKVEIWFAPRFLIEKEIKTTAAHFQEIFPNKWEDTAPVGIFWTWWNGDLKYYDYLTNQDFDRLSNGENLYDQMAGRVGSVGVRRGVSSRSSSFQIGFLNSDRI